MSVYYTLKDCVAVPCESFPTLSLAERRVAITRKEGVTVSTIFLCNDHSWGGGPPLLFETMVFGGEYDNEQKRCTTWNEAQQMHADMCKKVWP